MATCPDGHESTTTDFCDVCGRQLGATAEQATEPPAPAGEPCPVCGDPRTGRFCESCSYDFVADVRPQTTSSPVVPASSGAVERTAAEWTAVVSADRDYYEAIRDNDAQEAADVAFPAYYPERVFALRGKQIRIGRRSESQGVQPEIDLTARPLDPGISHLHALLVGQDNGSWVLVDPGSTNGTTVNGNYDPIPNDTPVPVHDGDRIHLGAWTTMTLRAPTTNTEALQ